MFTPAKNGIMALFACTILVVFSYFFIDQQVAFWVYKHHLRDYYYFAWPTLIPEIFTVSIMLLFPILAVRFFYYRKNTYHDHALFTIANSTVIALFLLAPLKFIFARYWPVTWVQNNLSLINNHVYGFQWFKKGQAYMSFPSGHTTVTLAVMTAIWFFYPRLRPLCILVPLLVVIGLVCMNYHFVGDIIAGGFLGGLTAYYVVCVFSECKQ